MQEYTPIRPRAGGLIHATSLQNPHKTACGRILSGWVIALGELECKRCEDIIELAAKARSNR